MATAHKTTWLDAWRNGMPLWRALRFHAQLVWRRWRDGAPDASPHRVTRLACGRCGDRWVGVVPVSDDKVHRIYWECAACNAMTAREVANA